MTLSQLCPRCRTAGDEAELDGALPRLSPFRSTPRGAVLDGYPYAFHRCRRCRGLWVIAGDSVRGLSSECAGAADGWPRQPDPEHHGDVERPLACSTCHGELQLIRSVTQRQLRYHVCFRCGGVWFDASALALLADPISGALALIASEFG